MTTYTPRAGDLARDKFNDVWFIYADYDDPKKLFAVAASHDASQAGHPLSVVRREWGPLRLEYRPAT